MSSGMDIVFYGTMRERWDPINEPAATADGINHTGEKQKRAHDNKSLYREFHDIKTFPNKYIDIIYRR